MYAATSHRAHGACCRDASGCVAWQRARPRPARQWSAIRTSHAALPASGSPEKAHESTSGSSRCQFSSGLTRVPTRGRLCTRPFGGQDSQRLAIRGARHLALFAGFDFAVEHVTGAITPRNNENSEIARNGAVQPKRLAMWMRAVGRHRPSSSFCSSFLLPFPTFPRRLCISSGTALSAQRLARDKVVCHCPRVTAGVWRTRKSARKPLISTGS